MKQQQAATVALVVALVALVVSLLLIVPGRQQTATAPTTATPGARPTVAPAPSATAPPAPSPSRDGSSDGPSGGPGAPTGPARSPGVPPAPATPLPTDQACATAVAGEPRRVRALSFNIHAALRDGLRLGAIAEEIAATGADVVFLQEVDRFRRRSRGTDQPSILAGRLGMEVAFGANVRHEPMGRGLPAGQYGTAVLSRWPITDQRNTALPNEPGLEQRGLLFAALDVDGTRIHVYGTHLQHNDSSIRLEQIRAVTRLVAADPVPRLLAGDLNAEPGSPVLDTVGRYLLDPWPVVGDGAGLTAPARKPRRRIDFVLHDHWFTPVAARTLRSRVSDHRGVVVDLDLRTLPGCLPG